MTDHSSFKITEQKKTTKSEIWSTLIKDKFNQ